MTVSNIATTTPSTPATRRRIGSGDGNGYLVLRSPREELTHISEMMDAFARRVFGYGLGADVFSPNFLTGHGGVAESTLTDLMAEEPKMDVYEQDDAYKLFVSLPGYSPDQIKVEATGGSFIIHGERNALHQDEKASPRRTNGGSAAFQSLWSGRNSKFTIRINAASKRPIWKLAKFGGMRGRANER